MKMIFRRKDKFRKGAPIGRVVWLGLSLALLLIAFSFFSPYVPKNFFHRVGEPFFEIERIVGRWVMTLGAYVRGNQRLTDENERLKARILDLGSRLLQFETLWKDNEELRQALGAAGTRRFVLGGILKRPPEIPYDTFLIDIGRNKTLRVGARVLFDGVYEVGVVSEVYTETALVKLLSSPDKVLNVLLGQNETLLQAKGRGGGEFEALVPKDLEIEVDDVVYMPGKEKRIIGVVGDVSTEPAAPSKKILFRIPSNIWSEHYVYIEL